MTVADSNSSPSIRKSESTSDLLEFERGENGAFKGRIVGRLAILSATSVIVIALIALYYHR